MLHQTIFTKEEMNLFGQNIAKLIVDKKISIVKLYGEIGVGKTTLSKTIIANITDNPEIEITSPTFNLVNCYLSKDCDYVVQHFDLYRVQNKNNVGDDIVEMINNKKTISIIEWPETVDCFINKNRSCLSIFIEHCDDDRNVEKRKICSNINVFL